MKYSVRLLSCFLLAAMSCQNTTLNTELLLGKWSVDSWIDKSNNQPINGQMDFEFKIDDQYTLDYGPADEAGKYWVMGDYLHTIAKGKTEKNVKIIKLTSDSFQIEMNRSGRLESVLLLKK